MTKMNNRNHEGHRQRIKRKVKRMGLKNFEEHEILELLLTYSIPRKDTNDIAHELINKFGSLVNVIDADNRQLKQVEGIGDESALFINVLKDFIEYYIQNRVLEEDSALDSPSKMISYFRNHYFINRNETILCLCLGSNFNIVNKLLVEGVDESSVAINVEKLTEYISSNNVKYLVVYHTHPNGRINPSERDISTTQRIYNICLPFGVLLKDHIVLNEFTHYSFCQDGLLDKIAKLPFNIQLKKNDNLLGDD